MSEFRDLLIIVLILGTLLGSCSTDRRDDSDPPGAHSGFRVYTDALTGAQYLAVPFGGMTPRLNADGSIHTVKP